MRLISDAGYSEVILSASAEELTRLATAVAQGDGIVRSDTSPGSYTLAGVAVEGTHGPGVLIRRDAGRQFLVISGDLAGRAVLAHNLREMATAEDGGHLHVDHFPGHHYLAEGSLPLVVESPHGGMPTGERPTAG
ncbi:hypothetical protein QF032_001456 [Streptomyces achromogenes]|uniref:Uncharacterized protein n=1 Tax=Streptomyces achromogenes TaxID=67255 RepID=A0ABU0PXS4_STRAH|nr:hypothetical protein [Streptomyces achromogenes]MDQ0682408.1 hypothetical protein [Streptomyces achromogenes]MDQ0829612.1 hypothetical protein [Streptomyces achromogenes]